MTYFWAGNAASKSQTADLTPMIEKLSILIIITLSVRVFAAFYWHLLQLVTHEFMVAILACYKSRGSTCHFSSSIVEHVKENKCCEQTTMQKSKKKNQTQCMTARGAFPWMGQREFCLLASDVIVLLPLVVCISDLFRIQRRACKQDCS